MNFAEMTAYAFTYWWLFLAALLPLPYDSFQRPGVETVGLVRDDIRQRWWANEMESREIRYLDDNTMTWRTALRWSEQGIGSGEPGPMAINMIGTRLWVVVEEATTGYIRRYDTTGARLSEVLPRIEIPPSARRSNPSITGLTFDGEYLWLVTDCGLCSTLIQFDPETGEELYDFFPAGAARGIAFRPAVNFTRGKLWMIAYNGPVKDPLLIRRIATGSPSAVNTSLEHFAFGDNPFQPSDPTALAIRGQYFWVADRDRDLIQRYSARDLP